MGSDILLRPCPQNTRFLSTLEPWPNLAISSHNHWHRHCGLQSPACTGISLSLHAVYLGTGWDSPVPQQGASCHPSDWPRNFCKPGNLSVIQRAPPALSPVRSEPRLRRGPLTCPSLPFLWQC